MTANPAGVIQVEIDGVAASLDQLRAAALGGYGHFTAMQVRGGRVRAFGRHLDRLDTSNQRLAHASGFDEALLTGPDAIISEGSITNIGFFDGAEVIWPAAPALAGITMQLLEPALVQHGLPSRRAHVRLADLGSFAAVFVTNARGIAPVGKVDDLSLSADAGFMRRLAEAYESAGWDSI